MGDAVERDVRLLAVIVLAGACASTGSPRPTAGSQARVPTERVALDASRCEGSPGSAQDGGGELGAVIVESRSPATPSPLDDLGTNVKDSFSGFNLLFYAGAVAATAAVSQSGADHEMHVQFNRKFESRAWNESANIGGFVLPAITGPSIWIGGLASHDHRLAGAGAAALQAVGITIATTGILKVATGRPQPVHDEPTDEPDHSGDWDPFRNGLGSWPSGHTAATTSTAAALTAYYPGKYWIPLIGYPVALAIGLGMVDRDAHWASDVVGGALIGQAIGHTVGRNFRTQIDGEASERRSLEIAPLVGATGISVVGDW